MSIEVHKPHTINMLLTDAISRQKPTTERKRGSEKNGQNKPPLLIHAFQNTEASKIATEVIEKECYKQVLCNERRYRELSETENTLVKDLEDQLLKNQLDRRIKYQSLYSRWEDSVYNRSEIQSKLSGPQYRRFDSEKRKLFSRYLTASNCKGPLFLDVISSDEYDPLCLQRRNIRTVVPVNDPTKLKQKEESDSLRIETDCGFVRSISAPRARRGSCNEWITLPIRDVDSSVRMKSRQRMMDKTACSRVEMERDELQLPKRRQAAPSYPLHRPLSQMFY
eukprot:sb/3467916/